jgi:hypothetical protein
MLVDQGDHPPEKRQGAVNMKITVFGGLLAAVGAPLIALSTSAIAAAGPDYDTEVLDAVQTWGPGNLSPGVTYEVGDTRDALFPALGDNGSFQSLSATLGPTAGPDLYGIDWTDRFADEINGQPNGDSIVTYANQFAEYTPGTGFTADLGGNEFLETLNSAGNLVALTDYLDVFGSSVTLFDFTL